MWLILIPLILAFAAEELIPAVAMPENRDMGTLLESDAGQAFLSGAWGWFVLIVVFGVFNTCSARSSSFAAFSSRE